MLQSLDLGSRIDKESFKLLNDAMGLRLAELQRQLKEQGKACVVLFHGWEAAGKGTVLNRLLQHLDPRGYTVYAPATPGPDEELRPALWPFWIRSPAKGRIHFYETAWYEVLGEHRSKRLEAIENYERLLHDSGVVILKFFFHISQDEQKKRFDKLESSKASSWRIKKHDWEQNRNYKAQLKDFEAMLVDTSFDFAPWQLVEAEDGRTATLRVMEVIEQGWLRAVDPELEHKGSERDHAHHEQVQKQASQPGQKGSKASATAATDSTSATTTRTSATAAASTASTSGPPHAQAQVNHLASIDSSLDTVGESYDERIKKLQEKISELGFAMYKKRLGVVTLYEGWDAAGKGGNIKRLCAALDPRGYKVIPIAAPSPEEKAHHYLWRFWRHLPRAGHMAIFDRTWYGRVLVERVEGFCSEQDWRRAYHEINQFEKHLHDEGVLVLKFWLQIDQVEQLKRFNERQSTPEKQWKITEEDWRNREKWPAYEQAVNDMIEHCSTRYAPWHLIPANSKQHARVAVLEEVVKSMRKALD